MNAQSTSIETPLRIYRQIHHPAHPGHYTEISVFHDRVEFVDVTPTRRGEVLDLARSNGAFVINRDRRMYPITRYTDEPRWQRDVERIRVAYRQRLNAPMSANEEAAMSFFVNN